MTTEQLKELLIGNVITDVNYEDGEGNDVDRITIYLSNGKEQSLLIAANPDVDGECAYFSFEISTKGNGKKE